MAMPRAGFYLMASVCTRPRRPHRQVRLIRWLGASLLTAPCTGFAAATYADWLSQEWVNLKVFWSQWPISIFMLVMLILLVTLTLLWLWAQQQRRFTRRTWQLQRELSERRRTETALRASEARFRDITEAASDWIWEMDENLRFTYLSDRFYALTGIAPQSVLGRTRWDIGGLDTTTDPQKWRAHQETLEKHVPFRDFIYQTQLTGNRTDGRYLKTSGKPIHDQRGRFRGYRGTGTDITEQIKAELALYQSELRLRRIIDLVPHMIFARDRHGHFLLANRATAAAYGTTVEDLVNPLHRLIPRGEKEMERMLADDQEVIEQWTSKLIPEELFTDQNGHVRTLQTMKIPFIEPGLNETAVLSVAIDITEQKRAKEEVARMRLYFKNMIDSMPSVLIGVDPWGYITVLNQPAERMSSVSWETAQGRFFGELFPQLESQFEQIRQAIHQGHPIKTPRMTLEIAGELHYADVMVYPLIADNVTAESASGAVIRMDDVTARVRIESMMVQTEKMLSVGGLAAGMAHEINNPLGAILQGSQNILRRIGPDMPQNRAVAAALGLDLNQLNRYLQERGILRFLEGIREAGTRAAKIVADMLSFSRRSESHFALVDVEEMLETVLRLAASDYDLKKKYDFKRILIVRHYDPVLQVVYCDKTEIEQVVLNLIKNAAQALADEGTPSPTITLHTLREADAALIEVIDNGPGMDDNTLKRIFEPFFTTKEVGAGTGLGLSVSYFIVTEQHNGRLSATSKPGQGSRFSIRLPLNRDAQV